MRYDQLFEAIRDMATELGLPEDWNPLKIDPALMTYAEYYKMANEHGKMHPESAYKTSVERMNNPDYTYNKKSNFPKLIQNVRRNGIQFEVRLKMEKRGKFVKIDPQTDDIVRINGEVQYYTDEESTRMGHHLYEWSLGVFEGDQIVAAVQDEWSCLLVVVAEEYSGFGFGPLLVKLARTIEPTKTSGGFTPGGRWNFQKVYREFVMDALKSGYYTQLVRQGSLTIERAKEIIASAKSIKLSPPQPQVNLADDPKDYLLYVGEFGDFIAYDRKLVTLLKDGNREHFVDRMVKGIVYVSIHDSPRLGSYAMLRQFGGDTVAIKRLLMACAITYAAKEKVKLYLEPGEEQFVNPGMAEVATDSTTDPGFNSRVAVPTGKTFDYTLLGRQEAMFRKSFDRYDEFKNQMMELAYGKFRQN